MMTGVGVCAFSSALLEQQSSYSEVEESLKILVGAIFNKTPFGRTTFYSNSIKMGAGGGGGG